MKHGYRYAIELLLNHYRELTIDESDPELVRQLREGIEYLCYPWREDLPEQVASPLVEPDEPLLLEDEAEIDRRGKIHAEMASYAWRVLKTIGAI